MAGCTDRHGSAVADHERQSDTSHDCAYSTPSTRSKPVSVNACGLIAINRASSSFLNPQVAVLWRLINHVAPGEDAPAVTEEADEEAHDVPYGYTVLYHRCVNGPLERVRYSIKHGAAQVESRTLVGTTGALNSGIIRRRKHVAAWQTCRTCKN